MVHKKVPVMGMSVIPGPPSGAVPISWSDDIEGGISVIGRPSVQGTKKVVQDAVQEPITIVVDPRRARPHPWLRISIRRRGCIPAVVLSMRRRRDYSDNSSSQQKHDH
jgi:hypothetical protein